MKDPAAAAAAPARPVNPVLHLWHRYVRNSHSFFVICSALLHDLDSALLNLSETRLY
jgi:hypothetical protein